MRASVRAMAASFSVLAALALPGVAGANVSSGGASGHYTVPLTGNTRYVVDTTVSATQLTPGATLKLTSTADYQNRYTVVHCAASEISDQTDSVTTHWLGTWPFDQSQYGAPYVDVVASGTHRYHQFNTCDSSTTQVYHELTVFKVTVPGSQTNDLPGSCFVVLPMGFNGYHFADATGTIARFAVGANGCATPPVCKGHTNLIVSHYGSFNEDKDLPVTKVPCVNVIGLSPNPADTLTPPFTCDWERNGSGVWAYNEIRSSTSAATDKSRIKKCHTAAQDAAPGKTLKGFLYFSFNTGAGWATSGHVPTGLGTYRRMLELYTSGSVASRSAFDSWVATYRPHGYVAMVNIGHGNSNSLVHDWVLKLCRASRGHGFMGIYYGSHDRNRFSADGWAARMAAVRSALNTCVPAS